MKNRSLLISTIVVAAVAVLVVQAVWLSVYTVDDAFISFRYARNLIEGNGLTFNPGERVEGYTNFLWTIILAPAIAFGADPVVVAKVFGMLSSAGTLLLVHRISVITRPERSPWFLSLLAVAMLAVNGAFATAGITGLETGLFAFLTVAGAWAFFEKETPVVGIRTGAGPPARASASSVPGYRGRWLKRMAIRPYASPIFFALAALTRPEGVIVFGVSLVFKALFRNFRGEDIRACARWCAVFAGIYLPYFAWRIWYYGELLPNTFYAKTGAGLAQFYKGILDLKAFSLTYFGIVFLVSLIVLARRRSPFWLTYMAGLVVTFVAMSIYEGGDWIPFFRFLVPALPFYYLVIQEAMRQIYQTSHVAVALAGTESSFHGSKTTWLPWAFGLAALILVALTALPSASMHEKLAREAKGHEIAHAALGRWLHDKAQGPIALMDIGRIGYISRLPIVDTSGLTDPTIAHAEGGLIDKKFDLSYILNRQPEYLVLASTTDFIRNGTEPTDFPIEKRIYADDRLRRYYEHWSTFDSGWEVDGKGYFLMVYERQ